MSGKGPPWELGHVGAETGGQPGQAGDALDAEFSGSLPGSCRRSPGVTARGSSSGTDSSQTRAGASTSPGQAGGWTLLRPSLPASRPPSDREEICAKCSSQRGGLCSNICDARPPHPSLQPPRGTFTPPCRVIALASSSSPRIRLRASSLSFDTCACPLAPGAEAPPGRNPSHPQPWLQLAAHFLPPGHSPPRWRSWDGSPGNCRTLPQAAVSPAWESLPGVPGSWASSLGQPLARVATWGHKAAQTLS